MLTMLRWVVLGRIRTIAPTMLQAETRPDQRGLSHLLGEVGGCDGEILFSH